jgi:hypothetical protein
MRLSFCIFFLFSFIGLLCSSASGASSDQLSLSLPTGASLKGGQLYLVRYHCVRRSGGSSSSPFHDLGKLFSFGGTTETFGFYLFKGAPKATPSADFNAAGAVAAEHVFTVDTKQSSSGFYNTNCNGTYIINGSDSLNVLAFYATSKTAQTKLLAGLATFASASIGPLLSIFHAGGLPDNVIPGAVQNSSTVLSNYSSFLAAFDNEKDISKVSPLKTGHLTIGTGRVSVEIDIIQIPTLLTAKGVPFRDGLKKILNDSSDLSSVLSNDQSLGAKCSGLAAQWIDAGLTALLDQAYVLAEAIKASGPTPRQMVICLGKDRAMAALPKLYLFRLPHEQEFTLNTIKNAFGNHTISKEYGQQPQGWRRLGNTADTLVTDLDRMGHGISLPKSEGNRFDALFANELKVEDRTFDFFVRQQLDPTTTDSVFIGAPSQMLNELVSKGFKDWGCYIETDIDLALASPLHEALAVITWLSNGNSQRPVVVRVFFNQDKKIAGFVMDRSDPWAIVKRSACSPPFPEPKAQSQATPSA